MSNIFIDQFVFPFIVRFFLIFGLISLAVGLGMLFKPAPTRRLMEIMNRWVSMRRSLKWLEVPRSEEDLLHRFRRPFGLLAIPILAYSTFMLIMQGDMKSFVDAFRLDANTNVFLVLILMETVRWCLIVFGLAAIVVTVMLIFFPGVLKRLETPANHWFSTRNWRAGGDDMHMELDAWILGRPKAMGGLIVVGALIVIFNFGMMLLK